MISSDWKPIFYQSLLIHDYLSCFCTYFLIDFVSEVFIIKVTVKENLLSEFFKEISCYNVESLEKFQMYHKDLF